MASRQVIGGLMLNTLLFLEYPDITPSDFDNNLIRVCFIAIKNLYNEGAVKLTVVEVDQEIEKWQSNSTRIYKQDGGLEFLKGAYEIAEVSNFSLYYTRLKKMALLRRLVKEKYDVSEFYIDEKTASDPMAVIQAQERYDAASLEDILNSVEGKYNIIRNDFLNGGRLKGDPAEGLSELIEELRTTPNIGPSLEGKIFSSVCRGAREGCFYLKAASTSAGKTRTSVFDACHLAYPIRWSYEKGTFIHEVTASGEMRQPRKVLFIVTEMDKEELQTIMLAFLSGVNEDHILTGKYEFGEFSRVKYAAQIIEQYSGYFLIEEISDPNLVNVEATIKRYATIENVKYVFFDYIHTTASLVSQFSRNNLREDVVLMLLANQLKQLAKDYNIFIFSATQVNAGAMMDDSTFKNETCIRGAKAIADKADTAYIMSRIGDKTWNSLMPIFKVAARDGLIDPDFLVNRPTHVLDIYKMRRGRYKNVRIWTQLDLGNGKRKDLFVTNADNQPIGEIIDLFNSAYEQEIDWKNEHD
jgi:replicative DNA helicase